MERLTVKLNGTYEIKGIEDVPCGDVCERNYGCETCKIHKAVEKLAEYEDLEEQGLLLRLPCKVGDTLWWTNAYGDLCSSEVNSIFIEKGIDGIVIETFICNIAGKEIGKTVFFTKEEAEQALARMEGEDG